MPDAAPVAPDVPLREPEQDRLGRKPFAQYLSRAISEMDASEGLVIALNGQWGSGKTTLLNFVCTNLKKEASGRVVILRFNPWWFSGGDGLLARFLAELSRLLGGPVVPETLRKASKAITRLGSVLKPIVYSSSVVWPGVASWFLRLFELVGEAVSAAAGKKKADADGLKQEIESVLRGQNVRVVVVVDDIDRLLPEEVREVFKIVKAIANFPNVIYLLAFDRAEVERALAGIGVPARFIDKIVQAEFDVPPPERTRLRAMLYGGLNEILRESAGEVLESQAWDRLYWEGIDAFVKTPREVARYLNRVALSYPAVRGEVNAVDFLGVQALRTFCPAFYAVVQTNRDLVVGLEREAGNIVAQRTGEYHQWLALLPEAQQPSVLLLMKRLFPRWDQVLDRVGYSSDSLDGWRAQLRVCSPENFDRFFSLSIPETDFSLSEARDILILARDGGRMQARLLDLARERLSDDRPRIWAFLDRLYDLAVTGLDASLMEPVLLALYDVGDDVSDRGKYGGFIGRDTDMRILGVSYKLLVSLPDQASRFAMLERVFSRGRSVYMIVRDVGMLGQEHGRNGADRTRDPEASRIVTAAQLTKLEQLAVKRLRADAAAGTLPARPSLGLMLTYWSRWGDADEVRGYVQKLVKEDIGLATVIDACSTVIYSSAEPFLERRFNRGMLVELHGGSPDELLRRSRLMIAGSPAWLSAEKRSALEAFVKASAEGAGPPPTS